MKPLRDVQGGGAAIVSSFCDPLSATFDGTTFEGNSAGAHGGGLAILSAAVNVSGSVFDSNIATGNGAGIYTACIVGVCVDLLRKTCDSAALHVAGTDFVGTCI